MGKRIILNRICCPDGTILTSHHVHDYKEHVDKVCGKTFSVDGGRFYLKRNVYEDFPYKELTIYSDASFEVIRESLYWGNFGKNGKSPLKWELLCNMSDDHIRNTIVYVKSMDEGHKSYFIQELKYRKEKNIKIVDK